MIEVFETCHRRRGSDIPRSWCLLFNMRKALVLGFVGELHKVAAGHNNRLDIRLRRVESTIMAAHEEESGIVVLFGTGPRLTFK